MGKKWTWQKYYAKNQIIRIITGVGVKVFHKSIPIRFPEIERKLLNLEEAQQKIKNIILAGKPSMIARFGSNEADCTSKGIGIRLGAKRHLDTKRLQRIHLNAGVFPFGEKMALRFSEISEEAAKQVDLLGWWSVGMQDYLALEVCKKDVALTRLGYLEPYYSTVPWTAALRGKKVLVVHPFKESIEKQYAKRELLFENPDMLPEFDLTVVKAVQTIAGEPDPRFNDWEEALNFMHKEVMNHDFDVAILGCGAYGMPLAAKIKESGKIAIHLGGATQLLFGIRGRRWDNTLGKKLYNEHWVRPMETEMPLAAKKIENGCYW